MSALFATNSVDGPRDLNHLAQLLREAGCDAAVWLIERSIEEFREQLAELEEYDGKIEEAVETAKEAGFNEGLLEAKKRMTEFLQAIQVDEVTPTGETT